MEFDATEKFLTRPLEYDTNILQKGGKYKVYKSAVILTPGIWHDMMTRADVKWSEIKIKAFATNWITDYINLGHEHHPTDFVGKVANPRYIDGALRGDLCINKNLSRGKDVIEGIDEGILNQVSVEVISEDYWDSNEMIRCADNLKFMGVSIIGPYPPPACKDVKIR